MKQRSLNFKVAFIVALLSVGSIAISYIGISKVDMMNNVIGDLVQGNMKRLLLARDIKSLFDAQTLDQRNIILEESPQDVAALKKVMDERHQEILKTITEFDAKGTDSDRKEMAKMKELYLKWWDASMEVTAHAMKNEDKVAFELTKSKVLPSERVAQEDFKVIVKRHMDDMDKEDHKADIEYDQARATITYFALIVISLSVVIAGFVLVALSKTINKIISDLTGSSEQVSTASQQIASSSVQLSEASTEQASSLEETVATLEELTSMVKVNSDHAKEAARLAQATCSVANKGEEEIRGLMVSMNEISQDSKKIEDIISVIDGIAFQTNLLALNAAVEAARAGEQGKGFAVVAEAVRNLAQRSASAAKDISGLIKGSVEKIERGGRQAGQSEQVLREILSAVKKVSDLNSEIAGANEEQTNGIMQIGKAMNQLDQVTQVNAATSEEAAASAEELSAQAEQLTQTVNTLSITIKGGQSQVSSNSFSGAIRAAAPPVTTSKSSAKVIELPKKSFKPDVQKDDWEMGKVGTTEGF